MLSKFPTVYALTCYADCDIIDIVVTFRIITGCLLSSRPPFVLLSWFGSANKVVCFLSKRGSVPTVLHVSYLRTRKLWVIFSYSVLSFIHNQPELEVGALDSCVSVGLWWLCHCLQEIWGRCNKCSFTGRALFCTFCVCVRVCVISTSLGGGGALILQRHLFQAATIPFLISLAILGCCGWRDAANKWAAPLSNSSIAFYIAFRPSQKKKNRSSLWLFNSKQMPSASHYTCSTITEDFYVYL